MIDTSPDLVPIGASVPPAPLPGKAQVRPGPGESTVALDDPALLAFGEKIRAFAYAREEQRGTLRSAISWAIQSASEPSRYIRMALEDLLSTSRPGRLDDAIEILSEAAPQAIMRFIDVFWWQDTSLLLGDDYSYVIVQVAGRIIPDDVFYAFCRIWLRSTRRPVREAVVEALGDRDDNDSLSLLEAVATEDEAPFIRQLAGECIADRRV